MEKLIKKYVDAGVLREKIIVSELPSFCNWSLSRKCLVGENDIEPLEILDCGDGNKKLSFENNRLVSLMNWTEINADVINGSNGIIITDATYGKPYFRFGFIPTE